MNKARIIGVSLLLIGILVNYFVKNSGVHFFSGILIGLGIGLIATGGFKFKKKN